CSPLRASWRQGTARPPVPLPGLLRLARTQPGAGASAAWGRHTTHRVWERGRVAVSSRHSKSWSTPHADTSSSSPSDSSCSVEHYPYPARSHTTHPDRQSQQQQQHQRQRATKTSSRQTNRRARRARRRRIDASPRRRNGGL
ncbi:hypothetical protein EI94DRAFT_1833073, partial [Lactarius quietus]